MMKTTSQENGKMNERRFLSDFARSIRAFGGIYCKIPDSGGAKGRFSLPRAHDGYLILQRRAVFFEAKVARPTWKLSSAQQEWLQMLHRHWQYAVIVVYADKAEAWLVPIHRYPGKAVHKRYLSHMGQKVVKIRGLWHLLDPLDKVCEEIAQTWG